MDKLEKRRIKLAAQQARLLQATADNIQSIAPVNSISNLGAIDCACVIHGDLYSWTYVEKLYNMLQRNISRDIRFHVYTESTRPVPAPMIRHDLTDLGISGPRRGWWYKMQLFNPEHHAGPLLYFDLDTVIVNNIDWIWQQPLRYFWAVRDFKYLWRPHDYKINSSIMWWDTRQFEYVWSAFQREDIRRVISRNHGDQDYISNAILDTDRRLFDTERVVSWRWQCQDGGYNFSRKCYRHPDTGVRLGQRNSVIVFHGNPKPADLQDPILFRHWN